MMVLLLVFAVAGFAIGITVGALIEHMHHTHGEYSTEPKEM